MTSGPLTGRTILVTRAKAQAASLIRALTACGAKVLACPTIEIVPTPGGQSLLKEILPSLQNYHWIIFASIHGVQYFFEGPHRRPFPSQVKICAIGPATAAELAKYGVKADLVPTASVSESIVESLRGGVRGKKILIPTAEEARRVLPEGLEKEGADVDAIPLYKTITVIDGKEKLKRVAERADLVTFTSPSTVKSFVTLLGPKRIAIRAASIGPVTSEEIRHQGIELACEAQKQSVSGLVDAILNYYR